VRPAPPFPLFATVSRGSAHALACRGWHPADHSPTIKVNQSQSNLIKPKQTQSNPIKPD
jgi:hypothetical protein